MADIMAEILAEYGPFPGVERVHGVTYDGRHVWMAVGETINAIDSDTGAPVRTIEVSADAGTAFDGQHIFQIADDRIYKIDVENGQVLGTIPAPDGGNSGMAWAEGSLWIGQHRGRRIHQVDPDTGTVLRSIESDRFVTGVTWMGDELWHGTWEGDDSDVRRIDPESGAVLDRVIMPMGTGVSGLECDGATRFFCGGGPSGKVRVVRKP